MVEPVKFNNSLEADSHNWDTREITSHNNLFVYNNSIGVDKPYIELVKQVANHPKLLKDIEPNLFRHDMITENQIERIVYAIRFIANEVKEVKNDTRFST